jgi:hypothetical protein
VYSWWSRCKKMNIIIWNGCRNIKLDNGACTVLKGDKNRYLINSSIPPKIIEKSTVRVKYAMSSTIECCIVYELINPQQKRAPLCQDYRVFIAIYLLIDSPSNYKTKVFLFKLRSGYFFGRENEFTKLYNSIIKNREHKIYNISTWNIDERALSLKSRFTISGSSDYLNIILRETQPGRGRDPILYEMDE